MRAHILSVLLAAGLCATAAQAQQFEPGEDVIVNPQAAAGGQVLLYPGGQYMRVVRPLREPGAHYGVIHLHMSRHHAMHVVKKTKSVDETVAEVPPAPVAAPVAPPPVHRHPHHTAPVASASSSNTAANNAPPPDAATSDLTQDLTIAPAASEPAPRAAKPAPRVASVAPAHAESTGGLSKHSMILFAAAAPDPAPNALGAIKFLASDLNADLAQGNSRIQILAYGGTRGDKGTEARRLSLKRALSIRQVLIDDGVPAERIDVRAMGGADDGGPADRVDVYVKS